MNPQTMGQNEPHIYAKTTNKGLYGKLKKYDFIEHFKPLLDSGAYKLSPRGTIVRTTRSDEALIYETPWWHCKTHWGKQCYIDSVVKFGTFSYIPPKCLECWKVTVAPRTLDELFKLKEIEKDLNRASKCGIELRAYTSKPYGGYFYNDSLDEGMDRYMEVRRAVDDHIDSRVPVILKRGCTEFEFLLGDSVGWSITPEQLELDYRIESYLDTNTKHDAVQPPLLDDHITKRWIEYASKIGDMTYKNYTDGESLYPEYRTYHDQDINSMKVAMVKARAKKNFGVDEKVADTVLTELGRMHFAHDIGRTDLSALMGFHNIDPFSIYEFGAK